MFRIAHVYAHKGCRQGVRILSLATVRAKYHLTPFISSIYENYQREIQKFTVIFTLIIGR